MTVQLIELLKTLNDKNNANILAMDVNFFKPGKLYSISEKHSNPTISEIKNIGFYIGIKKHPFKFKKNY